MLRQYRPGTSCVSHFYGGIGECIERKMFYVLRSHLLVGEAIRSIPDEASSRFGSIICTEMGPRYATCDMRPSSPQPV